MVYWRPAPNHLWRDFHGDQNTEWDGFAFARTMDDTTAKLSISMGAPQINGWLNNTCMRTLTAQSAQSTTVTLSHTDLTLEPGGSQVVTLTLTLSATLPPGVGDCVVLEVDADAGLSIIAVDSVTA